MSDWRNRGFTLVELLVVIGIIGILSAVLIVPITNMRETARAVKCKSNLKNLAQAAINYGVDTGYLPWAGSHEQVDSQRVGNSYQTRVVLRRGWVDWTRSDGSTEKWPKDYSGGPSFSSKGQMISDMVNRSGFASVTNGTLWGYMGRDMGAYVCDAHKRQVREFSKGGSAPVYRSYFMNGYFGYNKDYEPVYRAHRHISANRLSDRGSAANLLLFAELPVAQTDVDPVLSTDSVIETEIDGYNDGADTKTKPPREILGFNHLVGKRYVAHVAFADGHVDVLQASEKSLTVERMKGLTYFLCNGYELPVDVTKWKIP